MRRAVRGLLAERYAYPTWWVTVPSETPVVIDTYPEWDTCAGCNRWAHIDHPCPHCLADKAAKAREAA